jgi:hypothetical protein
VEKPKEFQRLLRYLTSIERAYFRVLDRLTKLQKERRAAESKQQSVGQPSGCRGLQPARAKRPNKSASFRKYAADVPRLPRHQLLNAYRKARRNAAA